MCQTQIKMNKSGIGKEENIIKNTRQHLSENVSKTPKLQIHHPQTKNVEHVKDR